MSRQGYVDGLRAGILNHDITECDVEWKEGWLDGHQIVSANVPVFEIHSKLRQYLSALEGMGFDIGDIMEMVDRLCATVEDGAPV